MNRVMDGSLVLDNTQGVQHFWTIRLTLALKCASSVILISFD